MDAKDIIILSLVVFIVLATWVYVYVHAGDVAYCAAVGGTAAIGAILQWMWMKDDKIPDRKFDNAP